jgi:hypothetical protein
MRPHSRLTSRQSKKFVTRRSRQALFVAVLVAVSVSTWLYSLITFTNLQAFAIAHVSVEGADPEIIPNLEAAALTAVQGSYLGLFSKSNSAVYPRDKVIASIEKTVPRVSSVKVDREGIDGLHIVIKEKKPAALICTTLPDFNGNNISLDAPGNCFFADEKGYIFEPAPSFSGQVYNRYYIPSLPDDVVGIFATSTDEFLNLQNLYRDLKTSGIGADAILMKDAGEYELYTRNPNTKANTKESDDEGETVVIYFNNSRPFHDELLNLIAFWNKSQEDAKTSHVTPVYEYIDVRYGSNVFYRKK